jgi:hypothetical protein
MSSPSSIQNENDDEQPTSTCFPHPRRPRACQPCRKSKTKCDMLQPICKVCMRHDRTCSYDDGRPRQRLSKAMLDSLQNEKIGIEKKLEQLENRNSMLEQMLLDTRERRGHIHSESMIPDLDSNGNDVVMQARLEEPGVVLSKSQRLLSLGRVNPSYGLSENGDNDNGHIGDENISPVATEASQFLSVDEQGQVRAIGPTSALYIPAAPSHAQDSSLIHVRNQLIANAAVQRQLESKIPATLTDIDSVPIELAMHLHDIHWNRQHHSFLLVYRPAYTRDMLCDGPYFSKFLANAIFASASKFSDRPEVRDDASNPRTAGSRFLRRSDELLRGEESPFEKSSIPTIAGLLLLGSTFIARGEVSKSWKYAGLAIRMVYDLGLHLDSRDPGLAAEDIEIRRRLFWGAFIIDKVQSLYLGRPMAIHLTDTCVSLDLMDTFEENDPWLPYPYPSAGNASKRKIVSTPTHSVSTFRHLCLLAQIMTRTIQKFYLPRSNSVNAEADLQDLDQTLSTWYSNLPAFLMFEPWTTDTVPNVCPNIIVLNTTFHSLCILLHRPFISNKYHSQSSTIISTSSRDKCTAAAKKITSIMMSYRSTYTLRGAPYLAGYSAYVACTIHVRDIASGDNQAASPWSSRWMLNETLAILDESVVANPCLLHAATIIRTLKASNQVQDKQNELLSSAQHQSEAMATMIPSSGWPADPNGGITGVSATSKVATEIGGGAFFANEPLNDSLFGFMNGCDFDDPLVWEWSTQMMTEGTNNNRL